MSWTLDGAAAAGTETRDEAVEKITLEDLSAGEHVVGITVTDADGAVSEPGEVIFTVASNSSPSIDIIEPDDGDEVPADEAVHVEIDAQDDEDDDLAALTLSWTLDGALLQGAPASPDTDGRAEVDLPDLETGTHTLSVVATDSCGLEGEEAGVSFVVVESCEESARYLDGDATVSTSSTEVCDGLDNACYGAADEDDATDALTWYADADADGFGDSGATTLACDQPTGSVADDSDCDDTDAGVNPSAVELCNGVDDDCDGVVDEADAADALVNPDSVEACNDTDDDCDGTVDEGAIDASTWYVDADGDDYGDPSVSTDACDPPFGYVADDDDCNDGDAAVNPDGVEVCNDVDDDCDGAADDSASDASSWYVDADGDEYGDPAVTTDACDAPFGYVADADDCDDTDADVSPDGVDICINGLDEDCDGNVDRCSIATATYEITGSTAAEALGSPVAMDGDIDGDGADDLLVGALSYADGSASYGGAAYVITGGVSSDGAVASSAGGGVTTASAPITLVGPDSGHYLGFTVDAGGDLDGDSTGDLIAGAPGHYSAEGGAAGGAYVYFGPVADAQDADVVLEGEEPGDGAATLVSAGDLNGDETDDAVVGASGLADAGTGAGGVYVVLGPISSAASTIDLANADYKLLGEQAVDALPGAICAQDDLDGDGTADLVLGAVNTPGGLAAGSAYVLTALGARCPAAEGELALSDCRRSTITI